MSDADAPRKNWLQHQSWLGITGILTAAAVVVAILGVAVAVLVARSGDAPPAASPAATTAAVPATGRTAPAEGPVSFESLARVANVTAGDTKYTERVSARSGDIVKFEAWYYNRENVDSGRYVAGLTVQVAVSETRSPEQVTEVTLTGANIDQTLHRVTVDVPEGNVLQFVPGSAVWRHNAANDDRAPSWVTTPLTDEIVGAGARLGDAAPCLACEGTVTFRAQVVPA